MYLVRQGVGKEGDVHVTTVLGPARVGESHDTVQEGVPAIRITAEEAFHGRAAAVAPNQDLRAFGQRCEEAGAVAVEHVVAVPDVAGVDRSFFRIGDIAQSHSIMSQAAWRLVWCATSRGIR